MHFGAYSLLIVARARAHTRGALTALAALAVISLAAFVEISNSCQLDAPNIFKMSNSCQLDDTKIVVQGGRHKTRGISGIFGGIQTIYKIF